MADIRTVVRTVRDIAERVYQCSGRRYKMRKVKMKCKRGMALLLAAALTVGMVPFFPGNAVTARAAGTSGSVSLHSHDDVSFDTVLTADGGTLAAGNYYLDSDIELSGAITISGTTNLCLNGHTLTGTGNASVIIIPNNVTLNLYDCKDNEGKITGGGITATSALYGGGVNVSGIFNMYGGTITENKSYVTDDAFHGGGGVYVNDGSFTMYGGGITDNTTNRPSNNFFNRAYGGGVDVYKGSFTLSGGTISNNYADNGGNVSVSSDASFTMDDGTISKGNSFNMSSGVYNKGVFMMNKGEISDNKKYGVECVSSKFSMNGGTISGSKFNGVYCTNGDFFMNGGTISGNAPGVSWSGSTTFYASGDAKVTGNTKNVSLPTGKKIIIMESGLTEGASIGITSSKSPTADESIDVTGENNADYSEYFFSDDGTYKIQNSGDGSAQVVQLVKPHVHSYTYSGNGAVITESCTCGHSETAALSMADGVNLTYTGYAIEACRITYSDGWAGGTLNLSYSNNINAGRATATISKNGETASLNFDIAKKSLTDSMIALASGPHNYTGSAVTPAVTVKDGSKTLVSGTDYTVSYANNTNVGTATVTVTGMGNYTETVEKTFEIILTDADQVAAAKEVVMETLGGYTATNSTTKQEIQDEIDTALTNAGISDVTVTVGDIAKTEATTSVAGSISGNISIVSKKDSSETDSVPIIKTIEKLPVTDVEKVADAKKIVADVLAGITPANETTGEDLQRIIDTALTSAGITDVTVTVGEFEKTEATTEAAGSISGNVTIGCGDVTDSVLINKTIAQLSIHTHIWTWVITKAATADEEGEMTGICTCGEVTTEKIPKTGENGSGTVIVKEDAENECNGSLADKGDVKGKVSLTDTEKEQLNAGEDVVIILRLKDVSVAADTQEKTEIQNRLETNILGTFLDIELLKQIGGTETKIPETTDEIEITFEIPEHLRNTDDTVTRTYQIMRNHDGVVDILDVENYDEAAHLLTFKTDKFSTYALVYRDDAKTQTPDPGPTATPEATDTPGTPTATPGPTDTPSTPTATPGSTDTPGTPTATPGSTDTPGIPTAAPGSSIPPEQPEPSILPEEVLIKNALSLNALLKVSQTGKKINIKWGQVAGADGYDVYVQYCGKKFTEKSITAVKSGRKTKVTVKKVNGKPLNLKKNYKIYILAYKLVDGKKVTLGRTVTAHIVGRKNAKYTNVKAVRVKKSSYSLEQGGTAVIKASTVLVSKGKKQLTDAHAKEFRYASTNQEVATVSAKGKITAVGKGTCIIYVYARNGYAKKIKVKVK